MQEGVAKLLQDAGVRLSAGSRTYRPRISLPDIEVKILKPQSIIEMLHLGSRDIGFAGADWVNEIQAQVVELLDTGLDPVRIVAAAPKEIVSNGKLTKSPIVVASEYDRLTKDWIAARKLNATFVHSYGATEVFPPEDADCIVDNTATGATLEANGLVIFDEVMRSSTRLYVNPKTLDDPSRRSRIEDLVLLLKSVLDARERVMLEVNVNADNLERVVSVLPAMREPTIAPLHHEAGYSIKSAVPRKDLPTLIPQIKARGGTDIIVSSITQIVS
jgi:ATP phosphoribosyltransferase